jgi:hypothetical protein
MVLSYDGVGQYTSSTPEMFLPPFTSFSMEAWVNLDGIPGTQWTHSGALWANNDDSFSLMFDLVPIPSLPESQVQQAQLSIARGGTTSHKFSYLFSPGQWYYIVVTVDTTTGRAILYVNAALSQPLLAGIANSPITLGPAWIGGAQQHPQAFYQGAIGMIRIWHGILDQDYIARLMYLALSGTVTAKNTAGQVVRLLANWRCNEGYGGIVFDYSGSSRNNMYLWGGDPGRRPVWRISTILKPPDFVDMVPVSTPELRMVGNHVANPKFIAGIVPPPPFRIDEKDIGKPEKKQLKDHMKKK